MKILKFSFVAPLQSWGEDARWDNRSTAMMPTKSGVIGFLGCCFGFPRGDKRLNELNEKIHIAVRVDQPGRILSDFQTVQGTGGWFINAENKPRTGGGTIITPKHYLMDARFIIYLQGNKPLLEDCYSAIIHPVWTPYLGRKSCVPSVPVLPEWLETNSLEEAVSQFSEEELKYCDSTVNIEMDIWEGQTSDLRDRVYTRKDNIIHAGRNEYRARRVKGYTLSVGGGQE